MESMFSAINVNTLNISTYKDVHRKTLEKLVAITNRAVISYSCLIVDSGGENKK